MKMNVGGVDRWIRIVAGIVILLIGLLLKSWWGLIGLLPLLTGLFGYCALYPLIGVNTCKVKTAAKA